MFRMRLLCVSAIALALFVNTVPTRAETESVQTGSMSDIAAYESDADEYTDDYDETSETDITGSTYGKIEQKILKKNSDISVSLDYGIDGYAQYDAGSQLILKIHSDVPFSGKVSVVPSYDEGYNDQNIKYSQIVSFDAGTDNVVRFYINELGYGRLFVSMTNDQGELVYSESDLLSVNGYEVVATVGVLSDDLSAFENLDYARVKNQVDSVNIKRLNMYSDKFPDSVQGLESVHYMLIDDFDTSELSKKQILAVQEWVLDGGTLILSLGENADKVLGGFDSEFIRYDLAGIGVKDVNIWSEKENNTEFNKVAVADITVGDAQRNDSMAGLYSLDSGYGRILILPYSLGDMAGVDANSELQLAELVLKEGYTDRINSLVQGAFYDNATGYGVTNALNSNKKKTVSPVILLIILIIYLIVCGPVTYIGLKKLKRREWIWIAVPAWAIVGTFAIFIVSTKYRVTNPLELTFTSADISDDIMRQNVYAYIIGSKAGEYSVSVDDTYSNVHVLGDNYTNSTNTQKLDVERTASDSGVELDFKTHVSFGGMSLRASSITKNDIGKLDSSLKLYTDGIEGSVTNSTVYDMSDVVVMTDGYYYCLDSLKAGETMDISRMQNRKMTNGLSIDCMKSYYVNKYGSGYSYNDDADVMMSRNYYMMLRLGSYSSTQTGMGRVAIWATIDRGADVSVDQRAEKYGSYVVYDVHTMDYEDVDGAYYSNIYTRDINRMEQSDYDENDLMMYSDQVDMDIKFQRGDNIFSLVRETNNKDASTSKVVVKAYNFKSGKYEVIFANGIAELNDERLLPYIQNDEMKLKFISPHQGEDYMETYLPRISARGGGQ